MDLLAFMIAAVNMIMLPANAGQAAKAVADFLFRHSVLAVVVLLLIALILIYLLVVTSDRHKKKKEEKNAAKPQ